jgi:protocatechuate 4,5-dioxygenase beta chain
MPIGLGLASSHVPNMFIPPEEWDRRYKQAIGDVPQPLAAAKETLDVRRAYAKRIEDGFATLRTRLAAYKPDAVIMISDDHGETFDREACMPSIAMFTGDGGEGTTALASLNIRNDEATTVRLKCHRELAEHFSWHLVKRGFDLAIMSSKQVRALGVPERGPGHGFTRTAPKIMPKLDVPTVLFWLNCYYEPLPTARRCIELGRAIADIAGKRPERIAIFGTGGLSHDPRGPRGGWIDEPLDRSVLNALAAGDPDRLNALFEFDSDTLRGGTGEIRNWLVVGGAMGTAKAEIIDYMPIHSAIAGIGFAAWCTN